jgi:hypothetical protein
MSSTRRQFLESSIGAAAALAGAVPAPAGQREDAAAPGFSPVIVKGNAAFESLTAAALSEAMKAALPHAPRGFHVAWGIPFQVNRPIALLDRPFTEQIAAVKAGWLVFLHTADLGPPQADAYGLIRPMPGEGRVGQHLADYRVVYTDGTESRLEIRGRHQIGAFHRRWGENCFQCVPQHKPRPIAPLRNPRPGALDCDAESWGNAETMVTASDVGQWVNWLWAWENPHPEKAIAAIRFEPKSERVIVSAISAGQARSQPLRWETRRKAILRLPEGAEFDPRLDARGRLAQIQLDMGQVISAERRKLYPNEDWASTYNNQLPGLSAREVLVEYTAHPDARFYLPGGFTIPVADLVAGSGAGPAGGGRLTPLQPATRRVRIRITEKPSGRLLPVKLHLHGAGGEHLAPVDRHRYPNSGWFEDYAPEFQHHGLHNTVYIPGETLVDLPIGDVYVEVSKGFEIRPIRKVVRVEPSTEAIDLTIEKALPWRERGWVTADTHVHFLSPQTAMLEGAAEGVNIINLLASQWGEMMTNVGDFDGKTTFGSREAGGDGEWLVRVGTENRQHVLGHISLLGYKGNIIAPMCSGGPDESALGDPVGVLLMEWAEQCRAQGGLVVLPHFPDPRSENAAALISGCVDALEMTSEDNLYGGIDPYSLSDYYRYLNCGHFIAAVGGTDKMGATTAVGAVRTYARIPAGREFTYNSWMEAVRARHTFVTYGPLMELTVGGQPPGGALTLKTGGGMLDVAWEVASVTVPMSKVELVVNGEVRESRSVNPNKDSGHWRVRVDRSSWLALMVRGHYAGKPEIITAHSSPVMVSVNGSRLFSALDAVTMLDQIEGALAYLNVVGTHAEEAVYRRMRLKLTAVHRTLHNELHQQGQYHEHASVVQH